MTPSSTERGEVWLARLEPDLANEQGGTRPVLLVSAAEMAHWPVALAVVVPVTTRDRGLAHHVPVSGAGLTRPSFAMPENVRSLSRQRLLRRLGAADATTVAAVDDWLRRLLGL